MNRDQFWLTDAQFSKVEPFYNRFVRWADEGIWTNLSRRWRRPVGDPRMF